MKAVLDLTDANHFIGYVASASKKRPLQEREELRKDLCDALDRSLQIEIENGRFVCTMGPEMFEILEKHNLLPVIV